MNLLQMKRESCPDLQQGVILFTLFCLRSHFRKSFDFGIFKPKLYYKEQPKSSSSKMCYKCLEIGHITKLCINEQVCWACYGRGHKEGDSICTLGLPSHQGPPPEPKLQCQATAAVLSIRIYRKVSTVCLLRAVRQTLHWMLSTRWSTDFRRWPPWRRALSPRVSTPQVVFDLWL